MNDSNLGAGGWRHAAARRCIAACFAFTLAGCSFPSASPLDASGPGTLTAVAVALDTLAATLPSRPTAEAPSSGTPPGGTLPASTASPTATTAPSGCSDRASFVSDVTIRDNEVVAPGSTFVKIWRLENAGTCTWTPDYTLVFFGGERMSAASALPLSATVGPGMQVDLPVDMVAPNSPGTYQGYWRLRSASGALFGIGPAGSDSFWIKIVVVASLTPSASSSPSPTVSPTPAVVAADTVDLPPVTSIDLDSGTTNPSSGADISFQGTGAADGSLVPAAGARLAHYTPPPPLPGPIDCQSAPLGLDPIATNSLSAGSLVCYATDSGRPGYFEVTDTASGLRIRFVTWNP